MNRQFGAERPDALWVADFTYVATWQGFVYVAPRQTLRACADVVDVFARRIVGRLLEAASSTTAIAEANIFR